MLYILYCTKNKIALSGGLVLESKFLIARDFDISLGVPVLLLRTRVRVTAPIAGALVRRVGSLEPKL